VRQGSRDKVAAWREILAGSGLLPAETAYAGDDIVDLPLLRAVGFSAAPSDAEPYVLDAVHFVASRPGGHGAVREIVEFLLRSRGSWDAVTGKYFSEAEAR
jgi:3-deoxy-D-manno-octulosonate 8-phosphate phosphatase (KDO 8-P phosphatase)